MSNVITMGKAMDSLLRRKLRGEISENRYKELVEQAQTIQQQTHDFIPGNTTLKEM